MLLNKYNLINNYNCGNNINICHVDLYRINSIKEIEKIGFFEEIENKIVLIEWPEKIEKILKKKITINNNPKKIKGPGQLKLHYSPGIPIIMNRKYPDKNQAFIGFGKEFKRGKNNFNLSHVDIRWNNKCNQACVYCEPDYSSKWAQELNIKQKFEKKNVEKNRNGYWFIIPSY